MKRHAKPKKIACGRQRKIPYAIPLPASGRGGANFPSSLRGKCDAFRAIRNKPSLMGIETEFNPLAAGDRLMGRYLLLWMLGVPLPILVLIYAFGGLH